RSQRSATRWRSAPTRRAIVLQSFQEFGKPASSTPDPYSLNLGKSAIRIWFGTNTRPSKPQRKRQPGPPRKAQLHYASPIPTIHNGCGDSPNPVAPWFSNIFRNSGNQLSTRRNPYSLNLGKTAIRIRSGTLGQSC